MAKYDKIRTLTAMAETGVVPVYYHADLQTAKNVLRACYEGGIRVFEFTNRGDAAHEVFGGLARYAEKELDGLILGAGSVVDPATAALYMQLGANFIVGPLLNKAVAPICNRRGVPYIPGCGSVTEMGEAQELGCDVCKLFPADVLGPAFVKGVRAPLPWTRIMVTGGVSPDRENLRAWFEAGVFCVGMGSRLFPKAAVQAGDWEQVSAICRRVLADVREIRSGH